MPDTILVVKSSQDAPKPTPCPAGTFNDAASSDGECVNCFCFGISNTCKSSKLFKIKVRRDNLRLYLILSVPPEAVRDTGLTRVLSFPERAVVESTQKSRGLHRTDFAEGGTTTVRVEQRSSDKGRQKRSLASFLGRWRVAKIRRHLSVLEVPRRVHGQPTQILRRVHKLHDQVRGDRRSDYVHAGHYSDRTYTIIRFTIHNAFGWKCVLTSTFFAILFRETA